MPIWDEQHIRSDNRTIPFVITKSSSGSAVNLTNAEVRFTVKDLYNATYANAKIKKANTLAGGGDAQIRMTDPVNGRGEIYILPADTTGIDTTVQYLYDLQIVIGGKRHTVKRSVMTILYGVTETA